MKKTILKLGKTIRKSDQKKINGGFGGCDIAPPGCPCRVPPGHPCLNEGGGGTGGSSGVCFTFSGIINVPCSSICPDGSRPICS